MKNILVPTDFSPNADNALHYALQIANRTGAEVHLLHTYQVNQSPLMFKDMGAIIEREAEDNMQSTLKRFSADVKAPARLSGKVVRDSLVHAASHFGKDHLIVMGTRGATDALEVFIGSTTGAVLKHAGQPVLAIPAGHSFRSFKNIVLALGSQALPPAEVFQALREIALAFSAEVKVFHLLTGEDDEGIDPAINDHLSGVTLSFHQLLDGDQDINQSINKFMQEQEGDLLCMVRRQRGFFTSLFQGSATTKQVYNSPAPLLVLMGTGAA